MISRPVVWYDVQLDLGVVSDAFTLLFRRWQEYLLLGFIIVALPAVLFLPGYVGAFVIMMNTAGPPNITSFLGLYASMYGGLLLGLTLAYPFVFGIVNFTLRELRTGDATLKDAWVPLRKFGRYAMAGLAISFLQGVASILGCVLGGFVVGGLFMYVMPIMLDEDLNLSDAISESVARLKHQWLMASAVFFVAAILASIGQAACGIGMLITYPLMYIIPTMLYLRHLPQPAHPSGMQTEHSPYPRAGNTSFAAPPMNQNIGEGMPPQQPDKETLERQAAEEELRRDTGEPYTDE